MFDMEITAGLESLRQQGVAGVLVTVVDTTGSTPRKPGARMLVSHSNSFGTIGGGHVEHRITAEARQFIGAGATKLRKMQLSHDLGMCCGGEMTFFMENTPTKTPLFLFGAGHVGRAVVAAVIPLGFECTVIDDLGENIDWLNKHASTCEVFASYESADVDALPFNEDAFVIIATREHALDQRLLEICLDKNRAYLGVIGSKRKALMQTERLRAKDFSEAEIATIHCPIGLSIGAQTPAEIATSVAAELIQQRANLRQHNRAQA